MPATLPDSFGRYRIVQKLGEGGMGIVYLAEDVPLRRQVALKIPSFADGESPQIIDRFVREARLAAQVVHPNLCPIHDVGTIDRIHYLAMAYIEGQQLARLIVPGQPWPVRKAVELVRQLALVIQVLHDRKILHRDLKPANVMIRPDDTLVLMDFGLARAMEGVTQRVTGTATVGTPNYMAPEQIGGDSSQHGPQTDVYALGVILFQLLTGDCPFRGATFEVLAQTLHAPPAPSSLRPDLAPELDQICLWALNKKPEHRPASMREFAAAMTGFLDGKPNVPAGVVRVICPGCAKAVKMPPGRQNKKLFCPRCRASLAPKPPPPLSPQSPEVFDPPLIDNGPTLNTSDPQPDEALEAPRGRKWLRPAVVVGLLLLVAGISLWLTFSTVRDWAGWGGPPKNKELVNSNKMTFVYLPPGTFAMGAPQAEPPTKDDELPQHEVEITAGFWIGVHEVTQEEYDLVMQKKNPSAHAPGGEKADRVGTLDHKRLPVENVTWEEANHFCRTLSDLPAEKEKGRTYRLPTEAEWEYACRAGQTNMVFHCGDGKELDYTMANFRSSESYLKKTAPTDIEKKERLRPYHGYPLPVGWYQNPNGWGLHDLHGNVREWCQDLYVDLYYLIGPKTDPNCQPRTGLAIPRTNVKRVVRGGGWDSLPGECRISQRGGEYDNVRAPNLGFRVVCVISPKSP